jgi:hypothetical protein
MTDNTPNPGSDEAIKQGCICAIYDNCHGTGFPWPRDDGLDPNEYPSFYVTMGCPVHAPLTAEDIAYEKAQASEAWQRMGGGEL